MDHELPTYDYNKATDEYNQLIHKYVSISHGNFQTIHKDALHHWFTQDDYKNKDRWTIEYYMGRYLYRSNLCDNDSIYKHRHEMYEAHNSLLNVFKILIIDDFINEHKLEYDSMNRNIRYKHFKHYDPTLRIYKRKIAQCKYRLKNYNNKMKI